jgi:uncharacterized protein (DUF885 family)
MRISGSTVVFLASLCCGATVLNAQNAGTAGFACRTSSGETLLHRENRLLLDELALHPVSATEAGYHEHNGVSLDAQLDDNGPAAMADERKLLEDAKQCFAKLDDSKISGEDKADLTLVRSSIAEQIFARDVRQPEFYRPERPVELIGTALFFPLTQNYGTPEQRLANVVARMEQVPRYLKQAQQNLREADPVFINTAASETAGDEQVIAQIAEQIPATSPLHARSATAASNATEALDAYVAWMKNDLAKRPQTRTWRAGPEVYARLFRFAVGTDTGQTPASLLASAEHDLNALREQMYTTAKPLDGQWFPNADHAGLSGEALENKVIAEVIGRINDDHTTPEQLLPAVQADATEIADFIRQKNLVTLSARGNLKIVPTPPFLRGVFSVAGFHGPPPLEPGGEGEYWVTPIAPGNPAAAESKLREYNNWMLKYLTMHEALPGHYTQFEHTDNIQPPERRIVRALLGNGPYIEGWGEYGVKEMEDAGYANHDPRFVLMVMKIRLRVIANAILDIRMQSMNMTDDEALALMENKAFQTPAEALGKLRRAKLTAGQLITYYVGYHQWIDLRDRYQQQAGTSFDLKHFNDEALNEGPLPIPVLEPLMLARLHAQK